MVHEDLDETIQTGNITTNLSDFGHEENLKEKSVEFILFDRGSGNNSFEKQLDIKNMITHGNQHSLQHMRTIHQYVPELLKTLFDRRDSQKS